MPDSEPIDLSQLQGLDIRPDWVEDLQRADTAGGEVIWGRVQETHEGGRKGPPRRDGSRGFDRGGGFRQERRSGYPGGDNRGPGRRNDRQGPRPDGPRGGGALRSGDRRDRPNDRRRDSRDDRSRQRNDAPPPPRLKGWKVRLIPEPRAAEHICRVIKGSCISYSVFEVGRLFMAERSRYLAEFSRISARPGRQKGGAPQPAPSEEGPEHIFQCEADGSLWLTREEAVRHLLHSPAIDKWYRKETVTVDPPKGSFTAVAVCGFTGALLGPPNHHDYPRNVARLHREKFSRMPIDRYKARIRIEKDEALLQKWQETVTRETRWYPVDAGDAPEPAALRTETEVEAHFLRHHAEGAIRPVTEAQVPGTISSRQLSRPLFDLLRFEVEQQQRFPMQLVQDLCRELERAHLKFFKRDRKTTYVCRTRPHFIENEDSLSDRIRSIIGIVRANPGIRYGQLVSILAPSRDASPRRESGTEPDAGDAPASPQEDSGSGSAPVADAPPPAAGPAGDAAAGDGPAAREDGQTAGSVDGNTAAVAGDAVAEVPPAAEESVPVPPADGTGISSREPGDAAPSPESQATEPVSGVGAETPPAAATDDAPPPVPAASPEAGKPEAASPDNRKDLLKPDDAEKPAAPEFTPEEIAVMQDIHWLLQEGYVTHFGGTNQLFILGRPPQPAPAKKPQAAAATKPVPDASRNAGEESAGEPATPAPESPAPPAAEAGSSAAQPAPDAPEGGNAETAPESAAPTAAPESESPAGPAESASPPAPGAETASPVPAAEAADAGTGPGTPAGDSAGTGTAEEPAEPAAG